MFNSGFLFKLKNKHKKDFPVQVKIFILKNFFKNKKKILKIFL